MKKISSKTIGAVAGLVIAGGVIFLAHFNNRWDSEVLRSCIHFLAGAPVFLLLDLPNLPQKILFLIYWGLAGGLLGWLLGSRRLPLKAAAVVIILALVISHRMVQVKVERELEGALGALGELFSGRAALVIEEPKP